MEQAIAQCREFLHAGSMSGRVLDVGCGSGELMQELAGLGLEVMGVEIDPERVSLACSKGLEVLEGRAEALPLPNASVDAVVSNVVLPYTEPRATFREWARVLKPGGTLSFTTHGLGYGLAYLSQRGRRVYGGRMLANTAFWCVCGYRLPGFFGDSLCFTPRSLLRLGRRFGFESTPPSTFGVCGGMPLFVAARWRRL